MSRFIRQDYPLIGESVLRLTHKSGLRVFLIPRQGKEAFALFGTKYGAMDHRFCVGEREVNVPDGIAHFLEHKLFENEDGTDTFSRFAALGASANAFTSNEMTAYLFSATGNYHESLEVLLDFVTHPYFTPATVEKEQGIIGQEIRMYEDDPDYRLYFGLLNCLYREHPIKIDIAGTVESIAKITDQTLYDCYNTFYHPQNMALVLCGPFEEDRVEAVCDKVLKVPAPLELTRTPPYEPREIAAPRISRHFPVAMAQFAVGLKETELGGDADAFLKRVAAQEVALAVHFGRTSPFFNRLYEAGTLSEVFSTTYQFLDSCAFTIFQGESDEAETVAKEIRNTLKSVKNAELSDEDFEIARRATYSNLIQSLNSPSDVATQYLSFAFLGLDLFRLAETVANLKKEDVIERISHWDEALVAESFILPKKGD
ncbi:MAG: insulinase family protein [Clostridia bacterium]|nr:insulinase family protein [Clostridia bacterium]